MRRARTLALSAWIGLGGLLGALAPARAQTAVEVPSREAGITLPGWWFPAVAPSNAAVVLLHGCGGVRDRRDALSRRFVDTAARLNALGIGALVIDSFGPRGERELCTQRLADRRIHDHHRRDDALGALRWLAAQPGLDGARLALLGWSHGGSAVLAATNRRDAAVADATPHPALAVAFYPGCQARLKQGYAPQAPLLLLVGADDDWTPAAPCEQLARQPGIDLEVYAGAVHGFDGAGPVVLRRDVPNGAHPGQGVHVGGHPAARAAAWARVDEALRERLLRR